MKRLLYTLAFSLSLLFISCTKDGGDDKDIQVKFINNTGERIEQVMANGRIIGTLAAGSKTDYIGYDEFGTDTGLPDIEFTGKVQGTNLESTTKWYWCGTEKSKLAPGNYTVTIELVQYSTQSYFQLMFQ